jgi:hypothetical protein
VMEKPWKETRTKIDDEMIWDDMGRNGAMG